MNKIRNNVRKEFTIIPNALINDNSLTDRARFLFCYMASKPEGWDFYQVPLSKNLGYSVDTLRKYIGELLESGWMARELRREGGKFDSYDYTLLPSPCGKNTDTVKNRDGKKPARENSALYNKNYYKEIHTTKKESENTPENLNFFQPDKHEKTADFLISHFSKEENRMWVNSMTLAQLRRAAKGYCLKLQEGGKWNDLQIPISEQHFHSWMGRRLAGIKKWHSAACEIDRRSGRTADEPVIKAPAPAPKVKHITRATVEDARKIAQR